MIEARLENIAQKITQYNKLNVLKRNKMKKAAAHRLRLSSSTTANLWLHC